MAYAFATDASTKELWKGCELGSFPSEFGKAALLLFSTNQLPLFPVVGLKKEETLQ
jgi:hypothetical protein